MSTTTRAVTAQTIAMLLVALALLVAVPGTALAAETAKEYELARLINAERRASGLGELQLQSQLTTIAREWSAQMAKVDDLYHRPDLGTRVQGDWTGLAENVGYGSSISRLHTAFMESPGHAKNVRGNYTHVGIGVVIDGSRIWVTVNFSRGQVDGTSSPVPAEVPVRPTLAAFGDVYADAVHAPGIQAVYDEGIVQGNDGRFQPGATITRAQMASYVASALGLDSSGRAPYGDVADGNVHTGSIAAVTAAGIMEPCATGRFCPSRDVSRGEMAQILTDAFDLPDTTTWPFTDITPGSALSHDVSALAAAGITSGCQVAGSYCPDDAVTRGQMATFFALALDLL